MLRLGLAILAACAAAGGAAAQVAEIRNTALLTLAGGRALPSNTVTLPVEAAPPVADLVLTMTATPGRATAGDRATYRLNLTNRGTETVNALHVVVALPRGLRAPGGAPVLDLPVVPLPAGVTIALSGIATVDVSAPPGPALARATARRGAAAASNEAAAALTITPALFTDAMTVLGEVRRGPCGTAGAGAQGVRLLLENGSFAITDADGRYHLEGLRPGRRVVQIDPASLAGRATPVLCRDDTRAAGSATSRFVEASGGMIARADFRVVESAPAASVVAPDQGVTDAVAAGDRDWLAGQQPGRAMLYPGPDTNPRAPVTRVVVKHRPGERVALEVGGHPVDPLSFDATDVDVARGVAVSTWSGIALAPGINRIAARVLGEDGQLLERLSGAVNLAGPAVRATLDPVRSRLVADGVHAPVVALKIVDGAGRPVRDGTVVRVAVDPPYAVAGDVALEQRRALGGQAPGSTVRVAGDDGLARVALAPTARAGDVRLGIVANGDPAARPSEVHAWLDAAADAWVVVGFAGGTIGHDVIDRHREGGAGDDAAGGRVALYAHGRIKGSWLLTLAYDSARLRPRDAEVRGTIDPNRYYTVYGDAARQGEDASGGGTLYVRVEAHAFYALFGDIDTGFGDTQLLRYVRTVDGVKAAYAGARVRASGFVARPSSRHVRDEVRGAGVTGPYRLSARTIVPDSETLTIEVRDRVRPERIVARTPLARHIDYEIDAATGTVRLRAPLLSSDAARNAVVLIAEYESDAAQGQTIAGARVVVGRGPVAVGASVVHDEAAGDATVAGLDVTARIAPATTLRAEAAIGGRGGAGAGHALLAEVEHHGRAVDVLGYAREQDTGFGVGQLSAVEAGTRKLGVDARVALAARSSVVASAWHQVRLDGAAMRSAMTVAFERTGDHGTLSLGGEVLAERIGDAPSRTSARLKLGASRALAGGALVLSGETQIGADGGSTAMPLRQRIDATYRIAPFLRATGGYEYGAAGGTARGGVEITPWAGASLTGAVNRAVGGEDPARLYAVYGVDQALRLGPHWSIDATLDSSRTMAGDAAAVTPDPFGAGPGADFLAATLGTRYQAAAWSGSARIELHEAARTLRLGLTAGLVRALGAGRTLGATFRGYRAGDTWDTTASLALALRPPQRRWSLLDRLELHARRGDVLLPSSIDREGDETRIVNSLSLEFHGAPEGPGFTASLYYGVRVGDAGVLDVAALALRQDLATWLDVGVQAALEHGWNTGTIAYSAGPSIGVSPTRGIWISGGYNLSGFDERDFSGAAFARGGPFLTLRSKFDQAGLGLAR